MIKLLHWLLPSCPNKDNGKLHQTMLDMNIDKLVYQCDVCHEEFI